MKEFIIILDGAYSVVEKNSIPTRYLSNKHGNCKFSIHEASEVLRVATEMEAFIEYSKDVQLLFSYKKLLKKIKKRIKQIENDPKKNLNHETEN